MDESAKILVIGKSQAGKSSFINYFIGDTKAATGKGKPCTDGYCIEYEYNGGGYPIKIYDNEGFEAAIANKQKGEIINFVREHNNSDNIFNWFHTIFYCTSAKDKFQEYEASFIKELHGVVSQNIHIIMTCCDGIDREVLRRKKEYILGSLSSLGDKCHVFEVVSVSMKKRNGEVVEPYGKEIIIESVFKLLWEDICSKVAREYAREVYSDYHSLLQRIRKEAYAIVDEMVSLKGLQDAINDDDSRMNSMLGSVDNKLEAIIEKNNQKYERIIQPLSNMYNSYYGIVSGNGYAINNQALDFLSDTVDFDLVADDALNTYFPNINNMANKDNPGFGDFIRALGELVTVKKRLKEAIDVMLSKAESAIGTPEIIEKMVFDNLMQLCI